MLESSRKRMRAAFVLAGLAAVAAGCASVTPSERRQYEEMKAAGIPVADPYDPTTAALLNILPGGGDIYNGEWGAFVLDLLFWPYSVVWAVPQAAITAGNKNVHDAIAGR